MTCRFARFSSPTNSGKSTSATVVDPNFEQSRFLPCVPDSHRAQYWNDWEAVIAEMLCTTVGKLWKETLWPE